MPSIDSLKLSEDTEYFARLLIDKLLSNSRSTENQALTITQDNGIIKAYITEEGVLGLGRDLKMNQTLREQFKDLMEQAERVGEKTRYLSSLTARNTERLTALEAKRTDANDIESPQP